MPEKFESPESGRENLSEKQKEILEGVGVESIAEVEDISGGVEESLKNAEEGSEEYNQLVEQKNYFEQVLKDLKE